MTTKKTFDGIALVIKSRVEHYSTTERDRVIIYTLAAETADYFEDVNPNFDRARFLTACGF